MKINGEFRFGRQCKKEHKVQGSERGKCSVTIPMNLVRKFEIKKGDKVTFSEVDGIIGFMVTKGAGKNVS